MGGLSIYVNERENVLENWNPHNHVIFHIMYPSPFGVQSCSMAKALHHLLILFQRIQRGHLVGHLVGLIVHIKRLSSRAGK